MCLIIDGVFTLEPSEIEMGNKFKQKHLEQHREEIKSGKYGGFGTMSLFSYIFREGSLFNSSDIQCYICNEIGNITDSSLW